MSNQALRDKLFHALRGDALPALKELDELVLADIDKIMPIITAHWEKEKHEWAELLDASIQVADHEETIEAVERCEGGIFDHGVFPRFCKAVSKFKH